MGLIRLNFLKTIHPFLQKSISSARSISYNKNESIEEIKKYFEKFAGGQVTLTKDDSSGIAHICLDHSSKKNAITGKMMAELNDCVRSLENWDNGKGLILYGKGDIFCAGGFLNLISKISNNQDGFRMATLMQDSLMKLKNLPLISLTLLTGMAMGGGAEICLSTDYRIASSNTKIAFVQAKLGVGPSWGGTKLLKDLIGERNALDLLLTCRNLGTEEALKLGLIDKVVEFNSQETEEQKLEKGREFLSSKFGDFSPNVIQNLKNILTSKSWEEEKILIAKTWGGPDQIKALNQTLAALEAKSKK